MSNTLFACRRSFGSFRNVAKPLATQLIRRKTTNGRVPLSGLLLEKARTNADEHRRLNEKIAESFDTAAAKRIGELSSVTNALQKWDAANESLKELQSLLEDADTDDELRDLASADIESATQSLDSAAQSLMAALTPRHPFVDLPCLLEIHPGAGGSEAALFAGDLLRMYQAYCQNQGLRATLLKYEDTNGYTNPSNAEAPLQEAILEIDSKGAYGLLHGEAGVHRVQRVPATETKGRTHTSAAAVIVLPSFPENENDGDTSIDINDQNSDYYVKPEDVRIDVMRARGAGGQHVNMTESAVRLTHIPTNTVVGIQDSRSQLKNRAKAWQLLRAKLAQIKREAREEETLKMRRSVAGVAKMGRGDKIRTYNWGQQRVTDHRSGKTVYNLDDVMEGGESLGAIIKSVREWLAERDIEGLLAEEAAVVQK